MREQIKIFADAGNFLNPAGDDFINVILAFWLCQPVVLLVTLPLVEQMTDRHEPHLRLRPTEERNAVKNQSGKQLFIAYPTCAFFEFGSLSTSRLVPLYMASMMAFLYSANSKGEVRSSTDSSASSSFFAFGFCRLYTSTD